MYSYNPTTKDIKAKPFEDVRAKFALTGLILEEKYLRTLPHLKVVFTEKILVGDAQISMGVTQESNQMTTDKVKATDHKKYAAKYQVSYLHKSLHEPSSNVLTIVCFTRRDETNGLVQFFKNQKMSLSQNEIS